MSDKLVAALFDPPSSSSRSRSRSRRGNRSRSRARPSAGAAPGAECGAGADAGAEAAPGARSDAGADAGSDASAEAAPRQDHQQDDLLQLWEDFDSEDTDMETHHDARAQTAKQLDAWARKRAKRQRQDEETTTATELAEDKQLYQLEEAYRREVRDTSGLPIEWAPFTQCAYINGDSYELAQFVVASRADQSGFYIGGTVNVRRRWLGDTDLPGHCEKYSHMCILGVAIGRLGGRIETALIEYGKNHFPLACRNVCRDSRGLTAGINFIYLCQE